MQDSSLVDVHYRRGELNEPVNYQGFVETAPTLLPLTNLLVQITSLRGRQMWYSHLVLSAADSIL